MNKDADDACGDCGFARPLGFEFTMAFQPIVDMRDRSIFAHEALVRGPAGEGAAFVLQKVDATNRYAFDQACRVRAIELAANLGMQSRLSINFMPNAVYRPEACIRRTLAAARRCGFPLDQLMFELTEDERSADVAHLRAIFEEYERHGFLTAIDDFGAGYAGLGLLAAFQPGVIKIDMGLVRDIDASPRKRAIVRGIVAICQEMGIRIVAEGVESTRELRVLQDFGIALFQGYLFARPGLNALPAVDWRAVEG